MVYRDIQQYNGDINKCQVRIGGLKEGSTQLAQYHLGVFFLVFLFFVFEIVGWHNIKRTIGGESHNF